MLSVEPQCKISRELEFTSQEGFLCDKFASIQNVAEFKMYASDLELILGHLFKFLALKFGKMDAKTGEFGNRKITLSDSKKQEKYLFKLF